MVVLCQLMLSIGRVTVSFRLHPGVEIHAAIYCSHHWRLPQRSTVRRAPEILSKTRAAGGAWFITSPLRGKDFHRRLLQTFNHYVVRVTRARSPGVSALSVLTNLYNRWSQKTRRST